MLLLAEARGHLSGRVASTGRGQLALLLRGSLSWELATGGGALAIARRRGGGEGQRSAGRVEVVGWWAETGLSGSRLWHWMDTIHRHTHRKTHAGSKVLMSGLTHHLFFSLTDMILDWLVLTADTGQQLTKSVEMVQTRSVKLI